MQIRSYNFRTFMLVHSRKSMTVFIYRINLIFLDQTSIHIFTYMTAVDALEVRYRTYEILNHIKNCL
jgi:hypothetical protein